MFDQADKLRQLVRETIKENAALEPGVPLVVVSGAQQGVGTSTVATRLAEELVQLGKRIALVDAHLVRPTLAKGLEAEGRQGIAEVLNGSRSAVEVLEPITSGLTLLRCVAVGEYVPDTNIRALRRLISELRTLHNYADLVVLDAGCGMSPWIERMWTAALQILLVTTTNPAAVRDAYSAVKMAPWGDVDGKLRLVVNRCDDGDLVSRVGRGFSSTCRQFLGMRLVGNVSQVANDSSSASRSSVRLLAADVLSHTCAYSQRLHVASSPATALSQASALLTHIDPPPHCISMSWPP